MIKRRRVRKRKNADTWITVIQVLREPRDEDVKNLGFRKAVDIADEPDVELLDEDLDGDTLMRDLEVDMLEDANVEVDAQVSTRHAIDDSNRIPPQWTPDRFLSNIVFDAVHLGGVEGQDSEALRDRIVGPFWRRPMEAYLTRVADDWEKTQPFHLRHLAVLRDQGVTGDKRFLHFIYRTFVNFQSAVLRKAARWDGASNPKSERPEIDPVDQLLDAWGFPIIKSTDLVRGDGAATLSEAGFAIVKPRKYGPRWDNALSREIGYTKFDKLMPKVAKRAVGRPKKQPKPKKDPPVRIPKPPHPPKKPRPLTLTPEEKVSMGLQPNTRLSKEMIAQISVHRERTGDPTSLPDEIIGYERAKRQLSVPLITAEDRIAAGMPARGRLGIDKENEIRKQRGLPLLERKEKKRVTKATKEEPVLSKQQRIALGWTDHGRLPQDIIEGLRQEREEGVDLKDSKVIAKYMDIMKAKKVQADAKAKTIKKSSKATKAQASPEIDDDTLDDNPDDDPDADYEPAAVEDETRTPSSQIVSGKRKAGNAVSTPTRAKRRRARPDTLQEPDLTPMRSQSPASTEVTASSRNATRLLTLDDDRMDDVTPTTTMEASPLDPPTILPPEDTIVPSVEVERPPAPVVKVYVQPDTSQLDARARGIFESYASRSSPGLYLNPTAKQKVPRGRPRKALMASFKLPNLAKLGWFVADEEQVQETPRKSLSEAREFARMSVAQPVEDNVVQPAENQPVSRQSSIAKASPQPPLHEKETMEVDTQEEAQDATPRSSTAIRRSNTEIELQDETCDALLVSRTGTDDVVTETDHGARVASLPSPMAIRHPEIEVELQIDAPNSIPLSPTTTKNDAIEIHHDTWDASPSSPTASSEAVIETETTPPVSEVNAKEPVPPSSSPKSIGQDSATESAVVEDNCAGNQRQDNVESGVLTPALSPHESVDQDSEASLTVVEDVSTNSQQPLDVAPEVLNEQSPRETAPVPRMVGGWVPLNRSQHYRDTPYKSPYAVVPSQTADIIVTGDVSTPLNTATEAAVPDDNIPLSSGLYSELLETSPPEDRNTIRPRGKLPTTGGSQKQFIRDIIIDIIGRCNGAFPGGREIVRPFRTLWAERHPDDTSLKRPSDSTILATLKEMGRSTAFGLKFWTFNVPKRKSAGYTYKYMYTWVHLTANSPEVKKLADNMSYMVHKRGHQYIPEEIRDLVGDALAYRPAQAAAIDESFVLFPPNPQLEAHIIEAKKRRRTELNRIQNLKRRVRKAQDALVQQGLGPSTQITEAGGRAKRTRLASLNDKNKQPRRFPLQSTLDESSDEDDEGATSDIEFAGTTKSGPIPLVWIPPVVVPAPAREMVSIMTEPEDKESEKEQAGRSVQEAEKLKGRLSTAQPTGEADEATAESESVEISQDAPTSSTKTPAKNPTAVRKTKKRVRIVTPKKASSKKRTETPAEQPTVVQKSKKRVRIATPRDQSSRKRARLIPTNATPTQDSDADDDTPYASEEEQEEEEDEETYDQASPTKTKNPRIRAYNGRQKGRRGPPPTLLERLVGLTGNPDDPIYQPPQRASKPGVYSRSWSERRKTQFNKHKKQRTYAEQVDPMDEFKKRFCTFVVASSMSAEDGQMDWSIVKKVHGGDKFFDEAKAQKLWVWMQTNMIKEVGELTTNFQSMFLEAYAAGKVDAIEEPENYDWVGLVRWAMRKCTYPELPLPTIREALGQFAVDESNYEGLDRIRWYKANIADRTRSLLQLQHTFTAPLHRRRETKWSPEDKLLKARSMIRSNLATPEARYKADLAHERLKDLGESFLVNVVGEFEEKQHLRMRKLKRLLPGRNFVFTNAFAKKYVRQFQLEDFMDAVEVKKKMDAAFASEDPEQRIYSVSRCEADASVASIMNMVSEGTVKLLPQLPPVNSEFDAPLPRLSVWGFCEGDYIHRAIDRTRMFWDIYVAPTANYKFGNPLQPLQSPLAPVGSDESATWPALPEPPLPGKYDAGALLPIWSSMDGQSVTWPWWYRVLNIVLQPLIFLAGATVADIHSHCPEHTTELFEVELVLSWLESVHAVKKTLGGGYITLPGFWATFGDKLRDTEGDWFGDHVRRKAKTTEKQQWRDGYNLRHSTLQARGAVQVNDAALAGEEDRGENANMADADTIDPSTTQQILKNPKQQYRIMQQVLVAQQPQEVRGRSASAATGSPAPVQEQNQQSFSPADGVPRTSTSHTSEVTNTPGEDIEMVDPDMDAEGEDIDAEGEIDDGMY
jgi:hypothetical protein